ncbi:MAG: hypothetical protein R3B82_00350 [Sandaracinaceae bacterium]
MADALDDVMQAFEAIGRELDKPDFEPDAGRGDWDEHADALAELRRRLEDEVLAHLDEAMKVLAAENPAAPGNLRTSIAYLTAELAAVHHAAGRKSAADALFARALRVGPDDGAREELEAAAREPDVFLKLTHARWHHRASDFAAGDAILRAAKRGAGEPALERAIRKSLDGPRPMGGSAPALFRINGFGFGLYGERDRRPDGSYIATYALSALWVPVLAIGAYRVVRQGNRYGFLAKERLSTFAKGWNFAVLGAIVLAIGWGAIGSYLDSPSRRAGIALEEARAFEDAGEAERAAVAYQHVIDVWGSTGGNATAAAAGLMRVLTTRVEAPLTASRVDEAIRVARRYEGLPDYARGGEPATVLSTALGEWADQIGDEDDASRMAALRLVDLGAELTTGSEAGALRARSAALHVAIAESLREEWPSEALRHFVQAGTPEAMEAATPLVASLGPSTLADVDADVRAWERAAGEPAALHHVAQLRTTLETWEADAQRTLALETGDAELLASLHEQQPEDQEAGAALADAKRATGEVDEAIALLETYGTPGRMSSYAQRSLASCYADGGRLPEADALLTRLVDAHLPAFQEAQQAFDAATQSRVESLVARARAGNAPSLNTRLDGVYDEARTQEIFDVWLREQIQADTSLAEIRDAYGAQTTIVPTVLALGTLKLRRAHDATGDERQAFLADAERLFLAIRQEAAGVPAYHLSLGQVYHRLGRTEEGEAELRGLLESGDPEMSLQVAGVYRELGLIERARAVATDVYDNRASGGELSEQLRLGAAQMMALMATTLDDREVWLGRAPQDNPAIRNELLGVRAERALRERNPAEASQLFAQVARYYESEGENPASLNNAAIADMNRYLCDGDPAHLDRAAGRMQRGLSLSPDNGLVVGNFAELEAYRADVRMLDSHVRVRALRLSAGDAAQLVGWLLDGPRHDATLAALRADPQHRHARELTQQEQVLAPQRPRGWEREWRWATDADDLPARRALLSRIREVSNIDHSLASDARRERTEAQRATLRRELDASVAEADAIVEAARRTRHAPTTAAALQLVSTVLLARAWETSSVEDAARAVATAREARSAWDGFGDGQLPWALLVQAAMQLAAEQPVMQATLDEHRTEMSITYLLEAAARRSPNVITALQESALLDEACDLRAAEPPERLHLGDILLGELAAHPGLTGAAAPARAREDVRVDLEIREALDPQDAELPSRRAILEG